MNCHLYDYGLNDEDQWLIIDAGDIEEGWEKVKKEIEARKAFSKDMEDVYARAVEIINSKAYNK